MILENAKNISNDRPPTVSIFSRNQPGAILGSECTDKEHCPYLEYQCLLPVKGDVLHINGSNVNTTLVLCHVTVLALGKCQNFEWLPVSKEMSKLEKLSLEYCTLIDYFRVTWCLCFKINENHFVNLTGATFALAAHVYTSMHKGRLHQQVCRGTWKSILSQIFCREKNV